MSSFFYGVYRIERIKGLGIGTLDVPIWIGDKTSPRFGRELFDKCIAHHDRGA